METPEFGGGSVDFRFKSSKTLARQSRTAYGRGSPFVGVSPFIVITGLTAVSASFEESSRAAERMGMSATDKAAASITAAQRRTTGFRDVSGDTRRSITNTVEARYNGYARSVGPETSATKPPVARFLIFGTIKMSRKWDFFGIAQPIIETWQTEMARAARVI